MALTRPTAAQINTIVTTISDPLIVLNKGSTQANIDVGFILNRNSGISSNAAIIWQESTGQFVLGLTSSSGAINANVNVASYANIRAGYFIGNGGQLTGLTTSSAVFTDANKNLVSRGITGTGSVVLSTNPTISNAAIENSLRVGRPAGNSESAPLNVSIGISNTAFDRIVNISTGVGSNSAFDNVIIGADYNDTTAIVLYGKSIQLYGNSEGIIIDGGAGPNGLTLQAQNIASLFTDGAPKTITVGSDYGDGFEPPILNLKTITTFGYPTTINGALTVSGELQLTGSATVGQNIATTQTTGLLTIGGASASGNITLGRSTRTQSINIGNSIVASGNIKTITIGTSGAVGSNTNIVIGPTLGQGNVTFGNNTVVTIANSLSVTGNVTATNYNYANGVSILATVGTIISTANTALKGYTDGQITTVNSSITTANTAMQGYVDGRFTTLIGGAPAILDTLNEIAIALGMKE